MKRAFKHDGEISLFLNTLGLLYSEIGEMTDVNFLLARASVDKLITDQEYNEATQAAGGATIYVQDDKELLT